MNSYQKIFGSGPLGLSVSLVLLALFVRLDRWMAPPPLIDSAMMQYGLSGLFAAMTLTVLIGAVRALPPRERGENLVCKGPFRYFRHPLYAAFLTFFNFGLAIVLNSWIYVAWAIVLHPVWHWIVGHEEALMRSRFPEVYEEYCARTGRFLPRLPGR